jgi:Domain of unknown function (DUF4158)
MKRAWHPDELAHYWTLAPEERKLLGGNTASATQLSTAVLLKSFQLEGRFPERRAVWLAVLWSIWPTKSALRPKCILMAIGAGGRNAASVLGFASIAALARFAAGMNRDWSGG